ncbi:endonuclease domain-containing protein [Candidatus Microgenomates bacterium]|nr:MAG: endonuclease domain-containing protein [Candidatus Microgenomates bacterium]
MKTLANHAATKRKRQNLRKNQTFAEYTIWKYLRNKQLLNQKFYRQYSFGPFIVDFYCPSCKLAIEIDGGQHAENQYYDAKRTLFLKNQHITVLRFWNNEVLKNTEGVVEVIEQTMSKLFSNSS